MEENSNNSFYYSLSDMKNLKTTFRDAIIENRRVRNEKMFFPTHLYIHNVGKNSGSSKIGSKPDILNNTMEPGGGALVAKPVNLLCPSDKEKKVLAIDLGGSFLKLCVYKLRNDEIVSHTQLKKYKILKDGSLSNTSMFDWVASKTHDFLMCEIKEKVIDSEKSNVTLCRLIDEDFMNNLTAGMTISYPIQHCALNSGYIREIGKDFPFKGIDIQKEELVECTTKAFKRYNINIQIKVLLNDTTATLASAVRSDNVFYVGIVLGTGTNIAFNDRVLYENQVINTEIASFDSDHLRKNIYDMKIREDILSSNKIYKPLDCMLGGYQLVKLFNLAIKDQFDRENYTLDDIVHLLDLPPGNSNYTEEFYVILSIKKRTMRILASMVFGILEAQEVNSRIKIVLNGTVFEQDYDRRIFIDEIRRLCADSSSYKYKNFTFESICDATLRGIARILLQID